MSENNLEMVLNQNDLSQAEEVPDSQVVTSRDVANTGKHSPPVHFHLEIW